jgi:hypothetical protein
VVAWDDTHCRLSLLRSLQSTHCSVKLVTSLPLIRELSAGKACHSEEYATLLLAAYDNTSTKEIRDSSLPYRDTLVSLIKLWTSGAQSCSTDMALRMIYGHFVEFDAKLLVVALQVGRIFSSLESSQKVNLCILLIESAASSEVSVV